MSEPALVIHGGAGSALSDEVREKSVRQALATIIDDLWEEIDRGAAAMEIAERGCIALEDCEHFNAGLGSAIQSDGQIRMSASIMDGARRSFSGVINAERVQNPTRMAVRLQQKRDRVVDGLGSALLAREMKLPIFDAVVERRLLEWWKEKRSDESRDQAAVTPEEDPQGAGMGTVGVVVCDRNGNLAASTSTGGRGFEWPGRVSDTATVSGNYATESAAVSCTGIGEDITDEALAARIVVQVEEGRSLEESVQRAIDAGAERQRRFAAIAVDRFGEMTWAKTTELLLGVGRTEAGTKWAF